MAVIDAMRSLVLKRIGKSAKITRRIIAEYRNKTVV